MEWFCSQQVMHQRTGLSIHTGMHGYMLDMQFLWMFSGGVSAQIAGKVFLDFNMNGVYNNGPSFFEDGASGVTITIFNASSQVGTTVSDQSGNYSIIPSGHGPFRVKFSGMPNGE